MKKIFILCIILIIISCNSNRIDYYEDMEKCINQSHKENSLYLDENVSIIDSISLFENYLIQTNRLENREKRSYQLLIDLELDSKELNSIINDIKIKLLFFYRYNENSMSKVLIYNICASKVINSDPKVFKEFYPILKIYEKIFEEGTATKLILKELSLKTDYNDKVSRLLLCNLIYLHWYEKYLMEKPNSPYKIQLDSTMFGSLSLPNGTGLQLDGMDIQFVTNRIIINS